MSVCLFVKMYAILTHEYSQPLVIRNSFIRKPCYRDRIFRNGSLTMGNTLIFLEIHYPEEISKVPKVPDNRGLTVTVALNAT